MICTSLHQLKIEANHMIAEAMNLLWKLATSPPRRKNNKITIHRLKNVPPLSAIFGRSSIIPFSALEDDDYSEQEAFSLPEGISVPLENKLFSISTSLNGDLSMGT
jgi:hypothetical protein